VTAPYMQESQTCRCRLCISRSESDQRDDAPHEADEANDERREKPPVQPLRLVPRTITAH
jgi:hypothetical protein